MKTKTEHKYFVYNTKLNKGKENPYDSYEKAVEIYNFLKDFFADSSNINTNDFIIIDEDVIINEIEKGDHVHWIRNGKPDYTRTDIVKKIVENLFGDIQYLTEEIGGEKRTGQAYKNNLVLADI